MRKNIIIGEPAGALSKELEEFFYEKGYDMHTVNNLKEIILMLQNQKVKLVVLDMELLKEDLDFLTIIKGMEKELPIIVCSEHNSPELEGKIRKQGIFYYHIKSFGIEDLKMAISNAVNGLSN